MRSTSAADRYIRHVPYLDKLQPEGSPNFSYQTHVTDISIGRACRDVCSSMTDILGFTEAL